MTEKPKEVELPEGLVLEGLPEGLESLVVDLVKAYESMKAFNGGYGIVKIYFKAAFSPYVDVEMRQFRKEDKKSIQQRKDLAS
jgi:hypothetical protein